MEKEERKEGRKERGTREKMRSREEEGPGEEVRGTEVVVGVAQGEVGISPHYQDLVTH